VELHGANPRFLDLGEGRPFRLLEDRLPAPSHTPTLTGRAQWTALFVRAIPAGTALESGPLEAFADDWSRSLRDSAAMLPAGPRNLANDDAVFRTLVEGSAWGTLVLMLGLFLLLSGSIWTRMATLAFVTCFALSLTHRVHFARAERQLDHDVAEQRMAAASRLGSDALFPAAAATALRERYEREPDPEVRAALLWAAAGAVRPCAIHQDARDLQDAARADSDPIVERQVERLEARRAADSPR
jgi:hypothetical protein